MKPLDILLHPWSLLSIGVVVFLLFLTLDRMSKQR
jgi:hypothetical protein